MPEFTLRSVEVIVFDEADRLFEMGFAEQLREIMRGVPEERQSLLFSATMPKQLVQFARAGLKDPVLIRLDTESKISTELRCVMTLALWCGVDLACFGVSWGWWCLGVVVADVWRGGRRDESCLRCCCLGACALWIFVGVGSSYVLGGG